MTRSLSRNGSPVPILALMAGLTVVAAGCRGEQPSGKASKPQVSASGKVQYDGKPLEFGTIGFISKDTGNSASCAITGGTFNCTKENGPNPGANTVLIVGKDKADGPPLWTWNSKVDVPADGLTNGDFSIDSKSLKTSTKK